MNIVYIILAHQLPDQLIRLVHRLNADDVTFFIHVDKKAKSAMYKQIVASLGGYKNIYFLDRYARYHGDFNHVKATLQGIRMAHALSIQYDYIILLTGQDYPIKSNISIQRVLEESHERSFIEYFPLPSEHWQNENGGFDRVNYFYLHWYGWEFPFLKRNNYLKLIPDQIWFALAKILPMRRIFPGDFRIYGGSAYWCLSRESAEYIYNFVQQNDAFVNFFKNVKIAEEIFFQTVLLNSPLRDRLVNDNLRYIIWSKSRHPENLCDQDFENLIKSNKLFARKFDMTVNPGLVDMIDRVIS